MMDYFEINMEAAEERCPYLIHQMSEFRECYEAGVPYVFGIQIPRGQKS